MRDLMLQHEQLREVDDAGGVHYQSMRVTERWETIGPDGEPVVTEASRADAIYGHLRSSQTFAYHAEWMAQRGLQSEHTGTPLCGVRKVVHYERVSSWEVVGPIEPLDELTEILSDHTCTHPPDRIYSGYPGRRHCSRCGATTS